MELERLLAAAHAAGFAMAPAEGDGPEEAALILYVEDTDPAECGVLVACPEVSHSAPAFPLFPPPAAAPASVQGWVTALLPKAA